MSKKKGSYRNPRDAAKTSCGSGGFVPHTRELLGSDAWQTMPVNTKRLIEYLELEHMRHGGRENGHLCAPYNQLMAFGIGRRFIRLAIDDAIMRGLILITHRGRYPKEPARYQLTYLQWKLLGATGPEWIPPLNQWREYKQPPKKAQAPRRRASNGQFLRLVYTNPVLTSD